MIWFLLAAAWAVLSLPLGVLIGKAIRHADRKAEEYVERTGAWDV